MLLYPPKIFDPLWRILSRSPLLFLWELLHWQEEGPLALVLEKRRRKEAKIPYIICKKRFEYRTNIRTVVYCTVRERRRGDTQGKLDIKDKRWLYVGR